MAVWTLLFNPACSKSQAAAAMLETLWGAAQPSTWRLRDYLREPLSSHELAHLADLLPPAQLLRDADGEASRDTCLAALQAQPERLQRPILVGSDAACLLRPPERLHAFLALQPQTQPQAQRVP